MKPSSTLPAWINWRNVAVAAILLLMMTNGCNHWRNDRALKQQDRRYRDSIAALHVLQKTEALRLDSLRESVQQRDLEIETLAGQLQDNGRTRVIYRDRVRWMDEEEMDSIIRGR